MTGRKSILLFVLAMAWSASVFAAAPAGPQPTGPLAGILAKIPNDAAAAAMAAYGDLVKLGPQGIKDLAALVVEPGSVDDSKARTAMHGLATYVSRPGADAERKMFSETVAGLLGGKAPNSVKSFFLAQLRLAGQPAAAPAIGEVLLNEELCEYAAQTLISISPEAAAPVLRQALAKVQGKCRLTIIQNLGVARDAQAGPELLKAAGDPDREVRLAALWALANIGDAAATDTILKAVGAESVYERAKAVDAALLMAQRLGDAKKAKEAEQIYRTLWKTRTGEKDRHIRCAAIRGLAMLLGAGAMDDLLAVMKDDDLQIRAAAVQAAMAMPGEEVTQKWVQQMPGLPPAARGEVLAMLARRGGPAAETAILDATKDKDEAVRVAAINAAAQLSNEKAAPAIVAFLSSAGKAEQEAAQAALGRMPGDKATAAVAAVLPSASADLKRALLAILAARGAREQVDAILATASDADAGVRSAALAAAETLGEEKNIPALVSLLAKAAAGDDKQAAEKALGAVCSRAANKDAAADIMTKAMGGADAATQAALIRTLARIGGEKALAAVRASAKAPEVDIQDAAIRVLASWSDDAAAPDLLELARSAAKPTHQVLALRGYVRLAGVLPERPVAEKLKMLGEAMAAAKRPDDKQMVLGAAGEVKSAKALALVVPAMADEGLKEAAAAAAVKIAKNAGGASPEIKAAMEKVLAVSKNGGTRNAAEEILKKQK